LVAEITGIADEPTAEDREVAATLLGTRPAEELVAQLVQMRRQALPAPEQLTAPRRHREPTRTHREPTRAHRDPRSTWFTINVGRSKHADPKWLIPLLCRRGGISKREIGKIEILMRETRVEIHADASARFAEAIRVPDARDHQIHIEPLDV
jgi:ATP-dependent RNA helicase DeaD